LRLEPNEASALNNLGLILYRKGEYQEAEASFRQAIDSDSNDALYHNNLGNALARQAEAESRQQQPSTDPPFAFPRTSSTITTPPSQDEELFGRRGSRKPHF
jgi:tetratricopeptide (TPR) repeat protein